MNLSDFDYPLPKDLIAQSPLDKRDASRLLIARRADASLEDRTFADIVDLMGPKDALVLNDTRVFKARILGKKPVTGGKVDALFLEPSGQEGFWRCLIQPALKEGQSVDFPGGVTAAYAGRDRDGMALLDMGDVPVRQWLSDHGTIPLPPYIKREPGVPDESTYQTVYAKHDGAVAAPTAGLHFTADLLEKVKAKGVALHSVTLHVGYGTFKPVDDLENHRMHAEWFRLSPETAEALNSVKASGGKVWAVGTTSLRVLETCVVKKRIVPGEGYTDLYIREPFPFEAVDRLITNFHLPKTTLLLLVSAFMGEAFRKKAYEHALRERYRFYSYGDAMVIL